MAAPVLAQKKRCPGTLEKRRGNALPLLSPVFLRRTGKDGKEGGTGGGGNISGKQIQVQDKVFFQECLRAGEETLADYLSVSTHSLIPSVLKSIVPHSSV